MEPFAGLGATAAAKAVEQSMEASGGIIARLFGPSADVLGDFWASRLQQRLGNVQRVVETAASRVELQPDGAVHPRVGAHLLDEAQWADDPVLVEYLSGVLASSHSPGGQDDRGLPWSSLVGRLTSDQLRLHYLVYASEWADRATVEENDRWGPRGQFGFYFPPTAMAWMMSGRPTDDAHSRFESTLAGLIREGLIAEEFTDSGPIGHLETKWEFDREEHATSGAIIAPSIAGRLLFLWGMGLGQTPLARFGDPGIDLAAQTEGLFEMPEGITYATWRGFGKG